MGVLFSSFSKTTFCPLNSMNTHQMPTIQYIHFDLIPTLMCTSQILKLYGVLNTSQLLKQWNHASYPKTEFNMLEVCLHFFGWKILQLLKMAIPLHTFAGWSLDACNCMLARIVIKMANQWFPAQFIWPWSSRENLHLAQGFHSKSSL